MSNLQGYEAHDDLRVNVQRPLKLGLGEIKSFSEGREGDNECAIDENLKHNNSVGY